jgi:hypothetical protein
MSADVSSSHLIAVIAVMRVVASVIAGQCGSDPCGGGMRVRHVREVVVRDGGYRGSRLGGPTSGPGADQQVVQWVVQLLVRLCIQRRPVRRSFGAYEGAYG